MPPHYAKIIYYKPLASFFKHYFTIRSTVEEIVIVSPYLSPLEGSGRTIRAFCETAKNNRTKIYLISKDPELPYQFEAIKQYSNFPNVEIRFNKYLHAKLYVCKSNQPELSFAMLGSANLTSKSITENIEIALLIYNKGDGKQIMGDLYKWANERLRVSEETKLIKKIRREGI